MAQLLMGKVALVTGAARGIGRAIAEAYAEHGAHVAVADLLTGEAQAVADGIQAAGGPRAISLSLDISDPASVQRAIDTTVSEFGRIDILVNNAGIHRGHYIVDFPLDDWEAVFAVNVRGTFLCSQAVARQMIKQTPQSLRDVASKPADIFPTKKPDADVEGAEPKPLAASYGKIVSLSSVAGRRGRPLQTHYAASKAAIISLTQSAALTLAPYRINCNAVCPGIVPTPMWTEIDKERGKLFGAKPGEAMAAFINTVPLKRAATAEDIAGAVAFFCSADSDYITGQALNVDGGYEMD